MCFISTNIQYASNMHASKQLKQLSNLKQSITVGFCKGLLEHVCNWEKMTLYIH